MKKKKPKYIEKDSVVKCTECKCLLEKEDAKKLIVYEEGLGSNSHCFFSSSFISAIIIKTTELYCLEHKKDYVAEFRLLNSQSYKFSELKEFKQ